MEVIHYTKQENNSGKKLLIAALFFATLFILIYLLAKALVVKPTSPKILREENVSTEKIVFPTATPIPSNELLMQAIQDALVGTKGSYGIVVRNLKTNESYSLNEHTKYDSASLYKLWVMAETYNQIKNGLLKEDDVLSEDVKVLNDKFSIASESAELQEGTITLSVSDALNKMITISDNYAAFLLGAKIRLSKVTSFLKTNELNESSVGTQGDNPQTSASDIALFFEKLYKSEFIDEEYDNKMLELLKAQRLNNKIPINLPDNITIAHKTGELDEYTHDGGIVYTENGDYIIVVLSKSDDAPATANRIAEVSEAVFNYFQNK